MTRERAQHLLSNSNEWLGPGIDSLMTREERREILDFWEKMPGNTCFIDAVSRIAKGIPAEFRYPRQDPYRPKEAA